MTPTQPTHPTTEVSEAMLKRFFAELKKRNAPLPFTEDARSAISAALSPGDGVPGMVLVPSDEKGGQ